ncbi:MAG: hypothetical protein IRZ09_09340 [Variibacter sp.]|nr:hypothetical protein [Variibacter sp.]
MASNHGFADGNKRTTLIQLHLLAQKRVSSAPTDRGERVHRGCPGGHGSGGRQP